MPLSKLTCFLMILYLSISTSVMAQLPAGHGLEVPVIPVGESRTVIGPHHFGGGGHSTGGGTSHFFAETGDAHHFSWDGGTSPSPGFTVVKYDFRSQNGFPNLITPGQKIALIGVFGQWSAATGNKLLFFRDTQAPASEIVNIGTGDLAALGPEFVSGPEGILGLGGGDFNHTDHTITTGVAWMDFAENWDDTSGNGNPPGTFDYFTVAAQEVGHALGLGHTDDLAGPDLMDGFNSLEQTAVSANDIAHIQSVYGSRAFSQTIFPRVGFQSYIVPDNSPLDDNPLPNQITYVLSSDEPELAVQGTVIANAVPGSSASTTITNFEISNLSGSPLPTLLVDKISVGHAFPPIGPAATVTLGLDGSYSDTLGGSITGADIKLDMDVNVLPTVGVFTPIGPIDPPKFIGPGFPSTPFGGSVGPTQIGPMADFSLNLTFELDGLNDAIVLPNSIAATATSLPSSEFRDFGDAPDSYKTLLASDGPRYEEGGFQRLGNRWDLEPNGQPTLLADGDDINLLGVGGPDDEDGVLFGANEVWVTLDITRPGPNTYLLDAWWDLNENGTFDHTGELIIDEALALGVGSFDFHFVVPFDPRDFYSRFRLTSVDDPTGTLGGVSLTTDITPWGEFLGADGLSHGEVEDYPPIPEPGTLALLALGGVMLARRRRVT